MRTIFIIALCAGCGLSTGPMPEDAPSDAESEQVKQSLEQWDCDARVSAWLTGSSSSINWTVKNFGAGACSEVSAIVRRCNSGASDCTQVASAWFALAPGATRTFSRVKPSCAAGQTLHVHTVFFPAPGFAPVYSFGRPLPCP